MRFLRSLLVFDGFSGVAAVVSVRGAAGGSRAHAGPRALRRPLQLHQGRSPADVRGDGVGHGRGGGEHQSNAAGFRALEQHRSHFLYR